MSITRKVGEFLGMTSNYPTAAPSPAPWDSTSAVVTAAGLLCELNRASCGNSIDLRLWKHHPEELMESSYAEEEMEVIGNDSEAKPESMTDAMVSEEREDEVEVEVNDVDESKEEDDPTGIKREAQMEVAVMKCKKTDGKGWHCKRDAQPPHSLCSYHLAQLRSYRARYDKEVSEDGGGRGNGRRKKFAAASTTGVLDANYYYYYSVVGPWWSKRRGRVDGSSVGEEDLGKESSESRESVDTPAVDGDDDDGDQMGDVKLNQEALTFSCADEHCAEDVVGSRCEVKKRSRRPLKKRGRKPVKARSLKSLL